jgi:aspartyl-tRNA(Asn)/glutamyl-tRNA(Gln) amidotransferase subunit C
VPLPDKEVQKIAGLAKLHLTSEEKRVFSRQLSRIIDYFNKLSTLELEGVKPLSHVADLRNVMRDDEQRRCLHTSEVLRNAPATYRNMFRVPKVIE